jgi:hypothetical protein
MPYSNLETGPYRSCLFIAKLVIFVNVSSTIISAEQVSIVWFILSDLFLLTKSRKLEVGLGFSKFYFYSFYLFVSFNLIICNLEMWVNLTSKLQTKW